MTMPMGCAPSGLIGWIGFPARWAGLSSFAPLAHRTWRRMVPVFIGPVPASWDGLSSLVPLACRPWRRVVPVFIGPGPASWAGLSSFAPLARRTWRRVVPVFIGPGPASWAGLSSLVPLARRPWRRVVPGVYWMFETGPGLVGWAVGLPPDESANAMRVSAWFSPKT